jgi:hypothetical protein
MTTLQATEHAAGLSWEEAEVCARARAHTHTRIFDLQLVDSADKEANYQTLSERYTLGPCFG